MSYESRPLKPPEPANTIVRDHLLNRDLCREGLGMFRSGTLDHQRLGLMLNEEHRILSETLGIATPLIDELQQLCNEYGAAGAKINGSGGGGTLFCYAPDTEAHQAICKVLAERKIRHYPVRKSPGARLVRT